MLEALKIFTQSEEYKRALAIAEQHRLAKRQQLVDRLANLKVEADKLIPPLQEVERQANARVEAAQKALKAAKLALTRARTAYANKSNWFESERAEVTKKLRETSSPEIGLFIENLDSLFERERHSPTTLTRERTNEFNKRDGSPIFKSESNYAARVARLNAIRAASKAAEDLRLEAIDAAALTARIDELRASIPPVE